MQRKNGKTCRETPGRLDPGACSTSDQVKDNRAEGSTREETLLGPQKGEDWRESKGAQIAGRKEPAKKTRSSGATVHFVVGREEKHPPGKAVSG